MTIEELVDPNPSVIVAACNQPEVRLAMDQAVDELTRLRFHEGLRRKWAPARAEASIVEATALAHLHGLPVTVQHVRSLSMGAQPANPEEALALGLWRAQWDLAASLPDLNGVKVSRNQAVPARLASWHRDICSALVSGAWLERAQVAIPLKTDDLATGLRYVNMACPALCRAAAIVAHFRVREIFAVASPAMGATLARFILTDAAVDPTGVAAISAADAENPAVASRALAGWVVGDQAGVARWLTHFAQSVTYGAQVGADIALRVQAGKLD